LRALLKGLPDDETAVFMDEVDVNLNRLPTNTRPRQPSGHESESHHAGSLRARNWQFPIAASGALCARACASELDELVEQPHFVSIRRVIGVVGGSGLLVVAKAVPLLAPDTGCLDRSGQGHDDDEQGNDVDVLHGGSVPDLRA
jgi:hypothetical protein